MPQQRPKLEAISFQDKQAMTELPVMEALPQGGVLQRHAATRVDHTGELPDHRGIEDLPPTEAPIQQRTMAQETAMQSVMEGCTGSLPDQLAGLNGLAPPTDTAYSWETPAQVYCALPEWSKNPPEP